MSYAQQQYPAGERRLHHQEMRQKQSLRDTFFGIKNEPQRRPGSVHTEFMDTDWDEEDLVSEVEDNSPRLSINSPSINTLSSYDEVPTPRSSQSRAAYEAELSSKPVEGPRGPHLFHVRSSTANSFDEEVILSLSPLTPVVKAAQTLETVLHQPMPPMPTLQQQQQQQQQQQEQPEEPFQYTRDKLDGVPLARWTPEMVAQSMLNAGIELSLADAFIENDINGAILITLKFEDLKELGIQSFGMRTKIWNQIQLLRDQRPESPRAPTPIEDRPSREVKKEMRSKDDCGVKRTQSSRRRGTKKQQLLAVDDIISPMESVSIVGIEQVIPKPHHCPKGENCSKWRKQQKLIEAFKKENPFVDVEAEHGAVLIAGDPGNATTAPALDPTADFRPVSEAVQSIVASSDIMGPGMPPLQYLAEVNLRALQSRDPQDNVRQFLDFQHQHKGISAQNEVPPTPPFEILPSTQPHEGLRTLPKLSIPGKPSPLRPAPPASASRQQQQQAPPTPGFTPYRMDRAEALSPDLATPVNPYRFGTPFSEMDVPVTAVPLGPIARDVSQSVPPDMNYRMPTNQAPRSQSRASRRPSFPLLPALDENLVTPIVRMAPKPSSPMQVPAAARPKVPPPRVNYPWSPIDKTYERALPPSFPVRDLAATTTSTAPSAMPVPASAHPGSASQSGISYQGPMKKRKTRMLRHEWHDGYFTLKGTRLAMHRDARDMDRTLEYIDIDDYAIACSSLASTSKLSAAFKAVSISGANHHSRDKSDPVGAFAFQLIPQDKDKTSLTSRLRKRESALPAAVGAEGVNGTGKTHHFAVKGRDERIDWMRELMLAKALKQKGEGFEISVNGNMI